MAEIRPEDSPLFRMQQQRAAVPGIRNDAQRIFTQAGQERLPSSWTPYELAWFNSAEPHHLREGLNVAEGLDEGHIATAALMTAAALHANEAWRYRDPEEERAHRNIIKKAQTSPPERPPDPRDPEALFTRSPGKWTSEELDWFSKAKPNQLAAELGVAVQVGSEAGMAAVMIAAHMRGSQASHEAPEMAQRYQEVVEQVRALDNRGNM
jgi:hypothetical protein